jgi:hypothetical protein
MVDSNSGNAQQSNPKEEQQLDQMVAQAVEIAAKGENVEQLLEVILESFPTQAKEKLRKKFAAALAKRGLRQPAADADIPSRGAFARIRDMLALSARQALDRIIGLTRSRPDVAATIAQAGKILMKNGVVVDKVQVSEADLGTMAPATGVGQAPKQGGRSA